MDVERLKTALLFNGRYATESQHEAAERRVKERAEAAAALAKLQAENERLNQCLRYEQHREGRIGTHNPNCHTWGPQHYECAIAKLEAAENALASIKAMKVSWTQTPSKEDLTDLVADINMTASRALGGGE
mgnify:CR=1 FL=1